MIDIITIGTGGGSIAWVDGSGSLRVGPKSAGADPGPMCYGSGGDEPTLTDATSCWDVCRLALLGGEVPLDVERARFGLERLAEPGWDSMHTRLAAGILEIADWNQVNAIRQVTVKKGLDPREYAMVAFGGSGPLQAARVAAIAGSGDDVDSAASGQCLRVRFARRRSQVGLRNYRRATRGSVRSGGALRRHTADSRSEAESSLEAQGVPGSVADSSVPLTCATLGRHTRFASRCAGGALSINTPAKC